MTTKIKASNIDNNAVTADKLHTTAVTDKLGFTPVTPTELSNAVTAAQSYTDTAITNNVDFTGYATESYVDTSVSGINAYTKSNTNPTSTTNGQAGDIWVNYSTGKIYICTDATTNANFWRNVKDEADIIYPNTPPNNPTNTASFPISKNLSETFEFTFSGATDSESGYGDSITHYLVDNFSSGNLTVALAEVAAGSAHSFTVGNVSFDESFTFRVRAKDSNGAYSSGITVSLDLIAVSPVVATGGTVTTVGDYKVHTFTSSGTFTVSNPGAQNGGIEYLVVAGGGGGGVFGAGGAGGYRSSVSGESSGGGAGAESAFTPTATAYTVTVGAGGANNGYRISGDMTDGSNSAFGTIVSIGGGKGGSSEYDTPRFPGSGGSGGGGASGGDAGSGGGEFGASGTSGQGYAGGSSDSAGHPQGNGGGGGGAGATGGNGSGSTGGNGGSGVSSSINGSSTTRAGGGGGGGYYYGSTGTGGSGGSGGGGTGGPHTQPQSGSANTGGGGGSSGLVSTGWNDYPSGSGGSGIVIVRYKYQNL
jgi:hypothetical protein